MANGLDKAKIINDIWQKVFDATQSDKVVGASNGPVKAYADGNNWIVQVPGLAKIEMTIDDSGVNVGEVGAIQDRPIDIQPKGDQFVNQMARDFEYNS